jgi:outer membrane protein OmpA-like peptidoglycan-associated protein
MILCLSAVRKNFGCWTALFKAEFVSKLFFIVSVISWLGAKSQNFVPNASFEDVNICEQKKGCSPSAWFYTVRNQAAGYFQQDFPAATGTRGLNIVVGCKENVARQYWQTMLLHKLDSGKTYELSMKVNGWGQGLHLNDLGFHFMNGMEFSNHDTLFQLSHYVNFLNAKTRVLKNGWFELTREFVADKDYQFLMVGNFSEDNYQEVAKKRATRSIYLSEFIDDVKIEPAEKIRCQTCDETRDSLYALSFRHSMKSRVEKKSADSLTAQAARRSDTLTLSNIYFKSGSFEIADPSFLDQFRHYFSEQLIKTIEIVGFTDDVGDKERNEVLSFKRAAEVAKLLLRNFKITNDLIKIEGRGISNTFSENKKNRRVEIYINR